jgi:hypothetical protein
MAGFEFFEMPPRPKRAPKILRGAKVSTATLGEAGIAQLAREASPRPGFRLLQAKLSRNSN